MKQIVLLLTLLLCPAWSAFCQVNPTQQEILNYQDSQSTLISKGRSLLLDRFLAGDTAKVLEIKRYLVGQVENKNYVALYPAERWLLDFYTQDYADMLPPEPGTDTLVADRYLGKIMPTYDLLLEKVRLNLLASKDKVSAQVKASSLRSLDKDYLLLLLEYLLAKNGSQEAINLMANKFLSDYPQSRFEPTIRKYIRQQYVPAKWGFTFEFFSGYGSFTKELGQNFSSTIPIGIAFDAYLHRWAFSVRNYIGIGETSRNLTFGNVVWAQGSQANSFVPELTVGYVVADSRLFKVSPFLGIASTDISPTEVDKKEQPDLRKAGLEFTTTFSVGTTLDIKLGEGKMPMLGYGREQRYWFLRLRYAYMSPQFDRHYPGHSGNMHNFTVGFGGFGRKLVRDY